MNEAPSAGTLIEDIYKLFDPNEHHSISDGNLEVFLKGAAEALRNAFLERDAGRLRPSNVGVPLRKLWYTANSKQSGHRAYSKPYDPIKFLIGSLLEHLVLFLVREAGHTVSHLQEQVSFEGVEGSLDAVIDGVVTDLKSASGWSFGKFKDGSLLGNPPSERDPFGYRAQLSLYAKALGKDEAQWLVVNKESGELTILELDSLDFSPVKSQIQKAREVISGEAPPQEKCYPDVEDGKSGNRVLGKNCSWCQFKFDCWDGLRTFKYADGPRYFTKVVKEPKTEEILRKSPASAGEILVQNR